MTTLPSAARGRLILLAGLLAATPALAQERPSSTAMTCAQAAGLVRARGAVVLGTGGFTYDRYVANQGFCLPTDYAENAFVPTRDVPQCLVGYRCKDRVGRIGNN